MDFRTGLKTWRLRAREEGVKANLDAAKDIRTTARILVPKRTGHLMAAIDAKHDGEDAIVGPTGLARSFNGPYGRAVELGGWREAHNPTGYMWWPGGRARANMMPSQPYLKHAVEEQIRSGNIHHIYRDHFLRAQRGL